MREIVRCPYCGNIVPRTHWASHNEVGNKYVIEFWCYPCQKSFVAEFPKNLHYSWTSDGYIVIKVPGIGWIKEHKYIWEEANGELPKGFVIHHINGDKTDNRLENLVAIPKKSHNRYNENVNRENGLISPGDNPSPTNYIP